jgi:hypothetical protein
MKPIVCSLLLLVSTVIRSRFSLQLEIVALRHQLAVYQRTTKRPPISSGDRILWSWLSRRWSGWRDALVFVQTGTVITWQRKVLFVLVVLAHHHRRVVHFNVTEHPTARWTGQQIIKAFPWDTAPKYLLRD